MAEADDWRHVLPRGYYAFPLLDDDFDCTVLGYITVRKVNGKPAQRGATAITDAGLAVAPARFREIEQAHACQLGEFLLEFPDLFRQEFGKWTGKCGCCGKRLTEPDSKTRGIGPDCWGRMGGGHRA